MTGTPASVICHCMTSGKPNDGKKMEHHDDDEAEEWKQWLRGGQPRCDNIMGAVGNGKGTGRSSQCNWEGVFAQGSPCGTTAAKCCACSFFGSLIFVAMPFLSIFYGHVTILFKSGGTCMWVGSIH